MTKKEFLESLQQATPSTRWSVPLRALWHDRQGNWAKAHDLVDNLSDEDASWVHAYLHRVEGDQWNANYWYRRAGRTAASGSLTDEWEELVDYFLQER